MTEEIAPIRLSIETPASPATAWQALTDPDRVVEWFTDASPLGSVGDPYRLDFGDGSVVEGVITERDDGRRFAHTWAWTDAEPRAETLVAWSVEALPDGGSRVLLEHGGWSAAGLDEAARDDHSYYWQGYLEDLTAILGESATEGR